MSRCRRHCWRLALPTPTFAAAVETIQPVTLSATLPALSIPTPSFSAIVDSPYSPPPLTNSVVLIGGYTPPPITDPIVLGAPDSSGSVDVTLSATLPALSIPTLTFAATVETIQPVTLSATLLARAVDSNADLCGGRSRRSSRSRCRRRCRRCRFQRRPLRRRSRSIGSARRRWHEAADREPAGRQNRDWVGNGAAADATGPPWVGIAEQSAAPIQVGAELLAAHGLRVRQVWGCRRRRACRAGAARDRSRRGDSGAAGCGLPQAQGFPADAGAQVPHADTIRTRTRLTMGQQAALPTALRLAIGHHQAQVTANRLSIRWQQAKWPDPGRWWPRYVVPPLTDPVVLISTTSPRPLRCPIVLSWNNVAQPPCGGGERTTRHRGAGSGVYVVLNTFSLVRADTSEPVLALDFDAAIDADSWTWTWSANVPGSQLSLVSRQRWESLSELIATLNGTPLRCVVENWAARGSSEIRAQDRRPGPSRVAGGPDQPDDHGDEHGVTHGSGSSSMPR